MDARHSPRFRMEGDIAFQADDRLVEGTLLNLSTGGCAVTSSTLFHKGEYLELRVYLPDYDPPVEVDLAAVRWASGQTCGLEFIRIKNEMQQQLRHILSLGQASALVRR